MVRGLKWLLILISGFFALLVTAAILVIWLIDLNALKPRIEALVHEQTGAHLQITGELNWSFYPYIGIEINQVSLYENSPGTTHQDPLVSIKQAAAGVALLPLIRQEIRINRVTLDSPDIFWHQRTTDESNWDRLLHNLSNETAQTPEPASSAPASSEAKNSLDLAVERIALINARVRLIDTPNQQSIQLSDVNLLVDGFSLTQPFALELGARLSLSEPQMDLDLSLKSRIQLNLAAEDYRLDQLLLQLVVDYPELLTRPATLEITGGLRAQMQDEYASAPLEGRFDQTRFQLKIEARQLLSTPALRGQLTLESPLANQLGLLAVELPERADPSSLSSLQLSLDYAANPQQLELSNLRLRLDDTQFNGRALVKLDQSAMRVSLQGDRLNADRYLPPPSEAEETVASSPGSDEDPELLPVALLRELNLDFSFGLSELILRNLQLTDIAINMTADNGLIKVSEANLNLYQGSLSNQGRVDVRSYPAEINWETRLNGVQLSPLLADLEQANLPIRGEANLELDLTAFGSRLSQWKAQSEGQGRFEIRDGALTGINISEQVCVAAARLDDRSSQAQWGPDTPFTRLHANLRLSQGRLNNTELRIAIPGFETSGQGWYHLLTSDFLYNLGIQFSQDADQHACPVSDTLASLRWPVECTGNLAQTPPQIACRPDTRSVTRALQDQLSAVARAEAERLQQEADAAARAAREAIEARTREAERESRRQLQQEAERRLRSLSR